jgi:CubicO group peptidase (beta-lactamase class C family)
MKPRSGFVFSLLLGFIALSLGCSSSDIIACDTQGCISEAKFSSNIVAKLKNTVTGYVVTVGGMPSVFAGSARTAANQPVLAMLPTETIDVASVSKTFTAIGAIQSIFNHNLSINSPISPYIYSDWVQGPNIKTITFEDLLTHASGFPGNQVCGGANTGYALLKSIIAAGVAADHEQQPHVYSNCNFAMFRELLFIMEGHSIFGLPDGPVRALASAGFYVSYMNQHVFGPAGVQQVTCAPNPDAYFAMLAYPFPAGTAAGWDGGGDWTLACGGGGWNLSAGDMSLVLNVIARGGTLLTAAQQAAMSTNYLGWDNAVRADCPSPAALCKNGDISNGNIAIWTYLGVFKCNVPVVVVVNSFLPAPYQPYDTHGQTLPGSHSDIIGLVADAFNGAGVAGAAQPCPAGSLIGASRG